MKYILTGIKKKLAVVTALSMIMTLSMPIGSTAATVSDISGHWANSTIQTWVGEGLIAGYPDGTFRPDRSISRAEFMTLVNRSYGYTATESISFSDVKSGAWYYNAVAVASAAGYISGYPDGSMKPDNPISREEAATIIMNINKLQAIEEAAADFTDVERMIWSRGAIGAVSTANIMNGYPDGSFGPQASIKRGETVVTIDRSDEYVARPAAPSVSRNDDTNIVSGMTTTMEYELDSANWDTYATSTFDKLVLSGKHTLVVRYAAAGETPFSQSTTLEFTEAESTGGGGGGGGGGGDDLSAADVAINLIEAYATLNTNPVPTVANYAAAGVTGVVAGNLAAVNTAVDGLVAVDVDTVGEIQTVVDGVVAIAVDLIEAYATLNTNPAPTVADYATAGVTGVVAGNLAAVNTAVDGLVAVDVDTVGEIQAVVDGVVAIAVDLIEAYATLNTNPAPTVADYATAGVTGVVAGNLAAVNTAVDGLVAVDVDTVGEIQAVVDGVVAIIAIDLIEAYATLNTNPAPTVADYAAAGATGVDTNNLAAVNAAVDALVAIDVDTVGEIQAVVDGVAATAINIIEAYATLNTNPAPTVADYATAGVTGVVAGNLAAVNTAVDGLVAIDVDTVEEIQAIVDGIVAIDLIEAYATLNTNPAPTAADYAAAGVTGVVAGNLAAVNTAVDGLVAIDVDTVGEIQAVVDGVGDAVTAINLIEAYATLNTNPAPTAADYAAAGVTGVVAGNLAAVNAAVDALVAADVDTAGEIQAVVDGVVAIDLIEAYATLNTNPAPTAADYAAAGVTGVVAGNLAAVNIAIDALVALDVDTAVEIQTIVDGIVAIDLIEAYATLNTNPAPTVADYAAAGVTGVIAGNLAAVNAAIDALTAADVDTAGEIQAVVNTI